MSIPTVWSFMAFSMALISYAMYRDISANIFLAAVFVIQGLRSRQEMSERSHSHVIRMVLILSIAISILATWALFTGADLGKPANFGFRTK